MRMLSFLSRVAFVCNVFFVISFIIQLTNWIQQEQLRSTIVLMGYILGIPVNLLVNLGYLIFLLVRKKKPWPVPAWLVTANVLFFIIQILYILYLNDPQHT